MRVLLVVHGYPPRFNAGSEVYTQALAHGLAGRHEVLVFCREENPFGVGLTVSREIDCDDPRVPLVIVNMARFKDRYREPQLDAVFERVTCPHELIRLLVPKDRVCQP